MSLPLSKPSKGARKAEQRSRNVSSLKPRKPLNRLGRVGREQMAWNASKRSEWMAHFGQVPFCSVHGHPCLGVQVGHIWGKDVRPELRFQDSNVAPLCARANGGMKDDLKFRRECQEKMGLWVERYYREKP